MLTDIKDAGFNSVMVDATSRLTNGFSEDILLAHEMGLDVPFAHLNCRTADDLWHGGDVAKAHAEKIIDQIKVLAKCKVGMGILHPNENKIPNVPAPKPTPQALTLMREIVDAAGRHGVKIALENTDAANLEHFNYVLDNIKSPWLGFCYDSGHHMLFTPDTDLLGKYGDRCIAVHFHSNMMLNHITSWQDDSHMLPYDGKVDFNRIIKSIKNSGYKGCTMLEVRQRAPIYQDMNHKQFLKEAFTRGKKIEEQLFGK